MKTPFVYDNSLVAIRKEAAKQEAINHGIDEDTALSIFTSGAKWYENIITPVAPPHEDKGAEEAAIQKHLISHGFNVLAKQNFINCMKEYASNERNRAIQEAIGVIKEDGESFCWDKTIMYERLVSELSKLKT